MTGRPDFSNFVAHFTSSRPPRGQPDIAAMEPRARLASILETGKIRGTEMPYTGARCAAFTECPWWSLRAHAQRFSRYAVGFSKDFLWARGAGPALYVRPDLYQAQVKDAEARRDGSKPFVWGLWQFITPLALTSWTNARGEERDAVNFAHEREWRVPGGLIFDATNVAFVIVDTIEDLRHLGGAAEKIGPEKFLAMSQYDRIEELWPTHR